MMRSIPVEWTLFGQGPWDYSTNADFIYNFWIEGANRTGNFESVYTVGMRGDGDCMSLKLNLHMELAKLTFVI
jgi:hypothetical protein